MLKLLRSAYRRLFPRLREEWLDAELPTLPDDLRLEAIYREEIRLGDGRQIEARFLAARYAEGKRWRQVLKRLLDATGNCRSRSIRVLDLGAGNGAVELALAADPQFKPVSVERLPNSTASAIHLRSGKPFRRVIGSAHALPFRSDAFDAILCLETLEHLAEPAAAGREAARVLRQHAPILLTTPARWRYSLSPDPHFGIRGLALLPAAVQRAIAARCGFGAPHHYVHRLYSTAAEVATLFPDCSLTRVLSRSRAPRRWSWDALVLTKTR